MPKPKERNVLSEGTCLYIYIYIYIYIYTQCQKIDPAMHNFLGYIFDGFRAKTTRPATRNSQRAKLVSDKDGCGRPVSSCALTLILITEPR